MNILFLDDDPERTTEFKANLERLMPTAQAVMVETASQAIEALRTQEFDCLFLDHDLGGRMYVDEADENTGSEVARVMVAEGLQPNAKMFVHSMNVPASENMIKMMEGLKVVMVL